ncbi:hypothetical protein Z517_06079 [Fonsecaea pedrosoi CBS 271.37]|uniref:Uncharacterized protein n=1 Tax=Fonsecaea pedrosoi CBS 271.37 TaxID=1442368 RepID=A0A0D2EYX7_9EURO|nr:uncharacterized protein Z517_06079 [Fonsecaea pedrosoi CBS 271.37]KIW79467.1 hypothetical protein Z517_06079 [Fonsecaea pedrosoi CBS 271.37]
MSSWTCGRTLSKEQRVRKREKDRLTKRQRKQAEQLSSLMIQTELSSLRSSLDHAVRVIMRRGSSAEVPEDFGAPVPTVPPSSQHSWQLFRNTDISHPQPNSISKPAETMITPDAILQVDELSSQNGGHTSPHGGGNARPAGCDNLFFEFLNETSTSLLQQFNEAFGRVYSISRDEVCVDEQLNQDALISGVLKGWDSLQSRSRRCPVWDVLRTIDEGLFLLSDILNRLCMLRAVHFMILVFVGAWTFNDVPPWYRPRPGIRERLTFSGSEILNNKFWRYFALSFRLHWPDDRHEAYCLGDDGQYRFSGLFEKKFRDIGSWTMNLEFFDAFPEMYDDIIPSTAVPLGISPTINYSELCTMLGHDSANHNNEKEKMKEVAFYTQEELH